MKVLIIEDESTAVHNLSSILKDLKSDIILLDLIDTIEASVTWLANNPSPDLIFMDIQLADGISFNIFDLIRVESPVVFTTAYDQYAIEAFKVNSIDYLLKPIKEEDVQKALNKMASMQDEVLKRYLNRINHVSRITYQSTFLVSSREIIAPIKTSDIAFFYSTNEKTTLYTKDGLKYPVNQTLENIFSQLDPSLFFRANRQYIISRNAVKNMERWFGSKLLLNLNTPVPEKIIISRLKTDDFKNWLINK